MHSPNHLPTTTSFLTVSPLSTGARPHASPRSNSQRQDRPPFLPSHSLIRVQLWLWTIQKLTLLAPHPSLLCPRRARDSASDSSGGRDMQQQHSIIMISCTLFRVCSRVNCFPCLDNTNQVTQHQKVISTCSQFFDLQHLQHTLFLASCSCAIALRNVSHVLYVASKSGQSVTHLPCPWRWPSALIWPSYTISRGGHLNQLQPCRLSVSTLPDKRTARDAGGALVFSSPRQLIS